MRNILVILTLFCIGCSPYYIHNFDNFKSVSLTKIQNNVDTKQDNTLFIMPPLIIKHKAYESSSIGIDLSGVPIEMRPDPSTQMMFRVPTKNPNIDQKLFKSIDTSIINTITRVAKHFPDFTITQQKVSRDITKQLIKARDPKFIKQYLQQVNAKYTIIVYINEIRSSISHDYSANSKSPSEGDYDLLTINALGSLFVINTLDQTPVFTTRIQGSSDAKENEIELGILDAIQMATLEGTRQFFYQETRLNAQLLERRDYGNKTILLIDKGKKHNLKAGDIAIIRAKDEFMNPLTNEKYEYKDIEQEIGNISSINFKDHGSWILVNKNKHLVKDLQLGSPISIRYIRSPSRNARDMLEDLKN